MVNIGSSDQKSEEHGKTGLLKISKPVGTQKLIDSIEAKKILTQEDSLAIKSLKAIPDSADIEEIMDMDKTIETGSGMYNTKKSYDSAIAKNPGFFDFIQTPVVHKFYELRDHGITKRRL